MIMLSRQYRRDTMTFKEREMAIKPSATATGSIYVASIAGAFQQRHSVDEMTAVATTLIPKLIDFS